MILLFNLIHIPRFSQQDAGKYLRELQKSLKNPAANLGLVVSEGLKRSKRYVCIRCRRYSNYRFDHNRGVIAEKICKTQLTETNYLLKGNG